MTTVLRTQDDVRRLGATVRGWPMAVTGVLLATSLIALWPLLRLPGLPQTADLELHLVRAVELDHLLSDGWLYPRWAPDFAYGYGFPIFNYYAPLGSYVIAGLHRLGLAFPLALKIAVVGAYLLYGPGAYLFARQILPPIPATLVGVAYLVIPFRFRELFQQGDYSQLLAMAILPWTFAALHTLVARPSPRPVVLTVLATSAMLLAHNITALHTAAALGLYALFVAATYGWWRLGWILLTGLGTLLLGAFFWLPALAEKDLVNIQRLATNDFHFSNHFPALRELIALSPVVDRVQANPAVPHNLGASHLVWSLTSLLGLVFWRRTTPGLRAHLAFGWTLLALAVFLMLPLSTPVWEHVPLLAFTEYPWRFRNLAGLALALLIGLGAHWTLQVVANRWRTPWSQTVSTALPALVALGIVVPNIVHLYPHEPFLAYDIRTTDDVARFERETGAVGTTSAGEYYPIWVEQRPGPSSTAGQLDPASLPAGATSLFVERRPLRQRYRLDLPVAGRLTFQVLAFPGWRARVDGQEVGIAIVAPHGLIGVEVPAGPHDLELAFEGTPLRTAAEVISVASLLLGAVGTLLWWRARRSVAPAAPVRIDGPDRNVVGLGKFTCVPGRSRKGGARPGGVWGVPKTIKNFLIPTVGDAAADYPAVAVALQLAALSLLLLFVLKEGLLDRWSLFSYTSPAGQVRGVDHPSAETLGGQIRFLGHEVSRSVRPGEDLRMTLYWQPIALVDSDYRSFVKVVRRSTGAVVAQSDHEHPGGMPTSRWRRDLYVRDEHVLRLPPGLPPMGYQIIAGLYALNRGFRGLPRDGASGSAAEVISLSVVTVSGARVPAERIAQPLSWRFDAGLAFLGYGYEPVAAPGDVVVVHLFWRAERPIAGDYTVFVHLLDAAERRVAQADGMPLAGDYRTSEWAAGDEVADRYPITLPVGLPPGTYHLLVGLYDAATGQRLEMRAPDGQRTHQLLLDPPLTVWPRAAGHEGRG
ncbi:MAG: hypothetical protein HYY04_07585 [Chloroflexi bacterium]|nr:hypothetical protein [Chloroflexota bacterium]